MISNKKIKNISMLSPNFIYSNSIKTPLKLNENWDQETIERIDDTCEDSLELTNILSSFSEDLSPKDNSTEEIINILRKNTTRVLSRSNPELIHCNTIIRPKFKRFIPERTSNPFHKNPFNQTVKQ